MKGKHTQKLNLSAVKILVIVLFNSFIQFLTHNVFRMIVFFILGSVMYSRALEIGQMYNQVLCIVIAMVVTWDCLIVLFKMMTFGKSVYLKGLLRRLFFYLIFVKGYYYLQDSNGVVNVPNFVVLFGLLIVFLIFGELIWPKLFTRYLLNRVLNPDYLENRDLDELSEVVSLFQDVEIQDINERVVKIDHNIVKESLRNIVQLETITSSLSLVRSRKRRSEYGFVLAEKRYELKFIVFLFHNNVRFYYRLPKLTHTKLLELETAVCRNVDE